MSSSIKRGETGTVNEKQTSCQRNFAMENELFGKARFWHEKQDGKKVRDRSRFRSIGDRKFDYLGM